MKFFKNNNNNSNKTTEPHVAKPLEAIKVYLLEKQHEKNYPERIAHFCSALNFLIDHRQDEEINKQTLVEVLKQAFNHHGELSASFFTSHRYEGLFDNLKNNRENDIQEVDEFVKSLGNGERVSAAILFKIPLERLKEIAPSLIPPNIKC